MLEIAARALSLAAIVGIGFGIKRLGWVTKDHFGLFARLVLGVTLPCALLTSFNDYHLDRALLGLTALGLLVNVVQQVIGYLLAARRERREQAFAVLNSGSYNIGAFATPYLSGFVGPQAMIYSTLFDIGAAVGTAGVGYGWGMALAGEPGSHRWRNTGRILATSPVFVTCVGLLLLKLFDLRFPEVLMIFTSTVGQSNPFLAMLMIGIGLELKLHPSKYVAAARHLAVRYAFSTLAAATCWTLLPLPIEARVILVMLLFAPSSTMVPGFTGKAGLDVELSAFITSVTLVIGIVAMPALYLLMR